MSVFSGSATAAAPPVTIPRLMAPVRPKRTVPALPAAADTKAASANRNINIPLPTVLIRVRYPGTAAADNIPTASVRPGLTKGLTAVPNTGPTVPVNAKRLITTTAATGLPYRRLTAAKAIMPTVRQNVKLQKANPSVRSVLFTTATEAARSQANTTAAKKLWASWLM